jgi:uncharacterized membrane protein YeaQ/YmgE (transglycosylase-associated protein family)
MIGMEFGAFLTLFVISFIAAAVVHYGFRYRFLSGLDGFLAKWIVGWIGAWVAAPVYGYWFHGLSIQGQYLIPALLGSFSTVFMATAICKVMAKIRMAELAETTVTPGATATHPVHETKAA